MRFSLQVGLTVKVGAAMYELVRLFENNDVQFEEVSTRRPLTLKRDDLLTKIYDSEYTVVIAEPVNSGSNDKHGKNEIVDLSALTEQEQIKLNRKYEIVKALQKLRITRGQRTKIGEALSKICEKLNIQEVPKASTAMLWLRNFEKSSLNPASLVDRYKLVTRKKILSDELEQIVWNVLRREYFTKAQHSIKHAHDMLRREINVEIQKGQLKEYESVSYATLTRRIKETDLYQRVNTREGSGRARMVTRTSFPDGVASYPLQKVQFDHTPLNWIVICDRTGLPLGRPLLTIMIDEYSGYILGIYISFYGPGLTSVCGVVRSSLRSRLGLKEAFGLDHEWLSHGLGDEWILDNGMEFHSFGLKQMSMSMGVDLMYCRVRTPWLKPQVERFFGGLNYLTLVKGRITKVVANAARIDPYKDAAIVFSDLVKGLLMFVSDYYPFQPNWRKMARPHDLLSEGLIKCPPASFPGSLNEMKLIAAMSKKLTFGHGGIEMDGLPYGSYDFKTMAKKSGTGYKVLCKWDPDDIHTLYVQPPETRDWLQATCRWPEYSEGLSYNQHKLIRKFKKLDLNSKENQESLLASKLKLHDHWQSSVTFPKAKDAQLMGRISGLTSSAVMYPALPQIDSTGSIPQSKQSVEASTSLVVPEEFAWAQKEVPTFETFNF